MGKKPYLLGMMPVRNEATRYLKIVLKNLAEYVDGIVILDDASTDETPDICRSNSKVVSYKRLNEPLFTINESAFREILWDLTIRQDPTWILALDADEIFEPKIRSMLPIILQGKGYNLLRFPVYHFWGDLKRYRIDGFWNPHATKLSCLYRYIKGRNYVFSKTGRKLHCGRFPKNVYYDQALSSSLRLFHLGYLNQKEHLRKFHFYIGLDPEGKYCPLSHYHSIVNPRPQLRLWSGQPLEALF